ncbi:hypothetical protein [Paraoerskovia marina]|nr:hypothetical protein [Paraoerskovia marina]
MAAAVGLLAAIGMAGGSLVAAASEPTAPPVPDDTVAISVIGDLPDGEFDLQDLQNVGVSEGQVAMISEGQEPVAAMAGMAMAADPNNPYQIMATWSDSKGRALAMRWGSSSWGWLKVNNKHNLTTAAVRTTTKYPKERKVESASSIRYRTPVHRVECKLWGLSCKVVETKTVRVVANPTKLSDGKAKGIITAYCEGVTWCPNWVKNAINA